MASDFTYVPTWSGTVYVAFVIDVFARRNVGLRASTSIKTQFVLDALEQAIWQRKTQDNKSLIHHSDRGSQYLSLKYTERLAEAEIDLSVGTVGDTYGNALAECVIGLFKTEVNNQIGPWKSMCEVEWETLKWVDWYNNRGLLGPIRYIPSCTRNWGISPRRFGPGDITVPERLAPKTKVPSIFYVIFLMLTGISPKLRRQQVWRISARRERFRAS